MVKKFHFTLLATVCMINTAVADEKMTNNGSDTTKTVPIEFTKTKSRNNEPYSDSGSPTGNLSDGFLLLEFSKFEGTATVTCTDLMTGDNCKYSTSGNGTSYQYIGEVSGPVQITVTTSESTYECVTFVE